MSTGIWFVLRIRWIVMPVNVHIGFQCVRVQMMMVMMQRSDCSMLGGHQPMTRLGVKWFETWPGRKTLQTFSVLRFCVVSHVSSAAMQPIRRAKWSTWHTKLRSTKDFQQSTILNSSCHWTRKGSKELLVALSSTLNEWNRNEYGPLLTNSRSKSIYVQLWS